MISTHSTFKNLWWFQDRYKLHRQLSQRYILNIYKYDNILFKYVPSQSKTGV